MMNSTIAFSMFFMFSLTAAAATTAVKPAKADRKPATVSAFEKIERNKISDKDNVVSYKVTAEKYYSLFSPDLDGMMSYYKKLHPFLPAHLKRIVEAREKIYSEVLSGNKNEKLDAYQLAQRTLTSFQKSDPNSAQSDYDFIALILIEKYFQNHEPKASEDAWIFRLNLRKRNYPEHEFEAIAKYITAFPKGKLAREKAQYLKAYLENDYRPSSGDQDIPRFEVERLLGQIRVILGD